MAEGRDVWWHDIVPRQAELCEPERMESEDMLYLLYTSGTTAKPKGILHTTGGYLLGIASTHRRVFDIKETTSTGRPPTSAGSPATPTSSTAPLANGTTGVIYEGTPDFPIPSRWWEIIERYKVTILYTAPTAIRAHMKWGPQYAEKHDLSSLRLLGTVGEPINPEAWIWYHEHIGGGRCPIVDTWWQTETGGIMISPLPGITTTKPGSATYPLPGVDADVVDDQGNPVPLGEGGYLVLDAAVAVDAARHLRRPRALQGDLLERFPGKYFPGDGASRDEEGYYWLHGPRRRRHERLRPPPQHDRDRERAGRRPAVAEAAVVGQRTRSPARRSAASSS